MAKVRIVYQVDDKELKALDKELKGIQQENKKVEEGFKGTNEEIKKSKTSLVDLKGAVASVGIGAMAAAAIVSFAKLSTEITKNRKEVALLTKATGEALDKITAKVRATSKVFEKDFNEVLRAANAVSKQLGITMTESMDGINDAMSRGLDINGQYLETISEYSPFMKQAGIDFKQFNILIQKQLTDGVFSDKGIDAIKEAVISIQEMTPATKDALTAVGLNTKEIIRDIESGAKTYFEVIQDIGRSLETVTDQTVRGQVLADVFRGAGEDAGDYALSLHLVGTEFEALTVEEEKFIKNRKDLLKANEDLNLELVKLTKNIGPLGTAWKTFLAETGAGTLKFVNDLVAGFDNLDKAIESYKQSVSTLTIKEQEAEWTKLTKQLDEVKERLDPDSKKYVFGISAEEKSLAQKELDTLTAKIKVLDDITLARTSKAAAAQKELNDLIEKERLARESAAKRDSKEAAEAKLKADKANAIQGAKSLSQLKARLAREDEEAAKILREEFAEDAAQKEIDDEIALNNEIFEITKAARARQDEEDKKDQDQKTELILQGLSTINEIQRQFIDLEIEQIGQKIEANEFARNRELELAEGNAFRTFEINEKFDKKQDELREKQKQKEKTAALISIAINTAVAVLKGISQFGPPPSPLGIAAIASAGIIGLAQSVAVLALKDGMIDIQGPGTRTSDSIPAMLSRGESVMTAEETGDYLPTLRAIRNREISPDIMNNIAMNQDTQPRTVVYDYEKLAKAVMNQPQKNLIADENGLTGYFIKQGKRAQIKQAKYRM